MNTPYICLRCRLRIARHASNLGKASFVSLGTLVNSNDNGASTARELAQKKKIDPTPRSAAKAIPRRQQYPEAPRPQHTGIDNVLEALFASNQRNAPPPLISRYSQTRAEKSSEAIDLQGSLESRFEVLKQKFYVEQAPLGEVWTLCLQLLGDGSKEDISNDELAQVRNSWVEKAFQDILRVASRSRLRGMTYPSIPTPAEIIRVYNKHGLKRYWWDQILWAQLGSLVGLRSPSLAHTSTQDLPQQAQRLIGEILDVWRLFFKRHGSRETLPVHQKVMDGPTSADSPSRTLPMSGQSLWQGLPSSDDLVPASGSLPFEAVERFLYLLPRHPNNRQTVRTLAAAVMTADCLQWLSDNVKIEKPELENVEPFVEFVSYLGRESKVQRAAATKCLLDEGLHREVVTKVLTGWGAVPRTAPEDRHLKPDKQSNHEVDANWPVIGDRSSKGEGAPEADLSRHHSIEVPATGADSLSEDTAWKKSEITSLSIDLHQAIERFDTGRAVSLWQTFQGKLKVESVTEHVREELFAQFLSAFFALRRSEPAVDVWNYMVRSGHKPTPKHWHAMIVGCTKSRDLVSMLTIWSNMLAAGAEPDMLLWTARINGLIICRKWQLGLQALEELGRFWRSEAAKAPEHKSKHDASSPSIIPINAAVRSLISIGKPDIAQSVLNWAKSQNIPLDTQTFNILLRPAVRASDTSEVQSILSQMHAHSCPPDVATFTIIINGLLSNPSPSSQPQSPAVQQSAVSQILADIEAAGLKANAHTYGTMLHGLLDDPLKIPAARAVLDHMAANKVKPSPHVYTILITHYFSTSPPDLLAIEGIWRRIKLERAIVDPIFYDRMIENYARIGEVEKMLFFLRKMPQEGKSPGWRALGAVLGALVKAEELESVRELIRDVEDETEGLLRYGTGSWRGREEFWEMVREVRAMPGIQEVSDGKRT